MKHKGKNLMILLLALCLLCTGCGGNQEAAPATETVAVTDAPATQEPKTEPKIYASGNYQYILLADGTAEITRYTGNAAELSVPDTLDGHSVTSIGDRAFIGCDSLTSIMLPEGLTSIGYDAFYSCDSLTSITLPEGLTSIGDNSFSGCTALTGITLPDSVTEMGINPFSGCDKLTDIRVSPDQPMFATIDGVLLNKAEKKLVCYPAGLSATKYQVPKGILSIGDWAFDDCTRLTSITLPEGLTSIGDRAFDGCPEDMQFTVARDSWAAQWCKENGKNYTYTDSLDRLND